MSEAGDHGPTEMASPHTAKDSVTQESGEGSLLQPTQHGREDGSGVVEADVKETTTEITGSVNNLQIDGGEASSTPDEKGLPGTPPAPAPPADADKPYLDPTPKTPTLSRNPSSRHAREEYNEKDEYFEGQEREPVQAGKARDEADNESSSEIQSIMEQFTDEAVAPSKEEIMSPRQEIASPLLGSSSSFPPRRSSLEPLRPRDTDSIAQSPVTNTSEKLPFSSPPPVPPKPEGGVFKSPSNSITNMSTTSLPKQLPEPEPEPELPFDFHRFLEQLRHKSADPVAKFLRSFLTEFGKRQWMAHEQVKIIGDFLAFITNKMAQCDVWREVSDNEFDNAKEGMEKLVMNRLYSQTFSPAIPAPQQPARSRSRSKRREPDKTTGPGRRGQHQEDVERDEIVAQKIRIYSWVREEHLDITPVGPNGERFLRLAQQELLKIKGYRAPRDKVICILNCCKVIFGLLKNAQSSDTSADSFVPLLIFVVLQSNPEHLVSNIQYILRFRNQDKLGGEAGYYLSSLSGAIAFIESLDRTTLTVSDEDFERHVELAVSAIAKQNREAELSSPKTPQMPDRSKLSESDVTPRSSIDILTATSPRKASSRDPGGRAGASASTDGSDEGPAAGLLKTIQRPLSTIGRIFSDQDTSPPDDRSEGTTSHKRLDPSVFQPPRNSSDESGQALRSSGPNAGGKPAVSYDAQEAAARQASAETAEARRIQRAEHKTVVDTLCGMFPNLDREVIDDVVRQKQGRVGLAVDACLALTAGG